VFGKTVLFVPDTSTPEGRGCAGRGALGRTVLTNKKVLSRGIEEACRKSREGVALF